MRSFPLFLLPGAEESTASPGAMQGSPGPWGSSGGRTGGGPSSPWAARPARASVPFEVGDWRRGFGTGRHLCSPAGSEQEGWLPSLPHMALSPLNGSPAGKPRQSPVPPSPTSLSPGDASFPPPHLSLLFLANSPPPPGSSRSHNSILFMETNCPAGGCT